jgi:hypothetical protein
MLNEQAFLQKCRDFAVKEQERNVKWPAIYPADYFSLSKHRLYGTTQYPSRVKNGDVFDLDISSIISPFFIPFFDLS